MGLGLTNFTLEGGVSGRTSLKIEGKGNSEMTLLSGRTIELQVKGQFDSAFLGLIVKISHKRCKQVIFELWAWA